MAGLDATEAGNVPPPVDVVGRFDSGPRCQMMEKT